LETNPASFARKPSLLLPKSSTCVRHPLVPTPRNPRRPKSLCRTQKFFPIPPRAAPQEKLKLTRDHRVFAVLCTSIGRKGVSIMTKGYSAPVFLTLFLTASLHAQLATTSSLVGTVSDSSGKSIPKAKVTAVEAGTLDTHTTM